MKNNDPTMSTNTLDEAIDSLWADLESQADLPENRPLIAHYTSFSTIEKVLEKEEIWFSHPFYMNDTQELWYNMHLCQGVLEHECSRRVQDESTHVQVRNQIYLLQYLFHEIVGFHEKEYFKDIYVFCASIHKMNDQDGLLSMWRGYGDAGSGAAIVFDTRKFGKYEDFPFVFGQVEYRDDDWREKWIKEKITSYLKQLVQLTLSKQDVMRASHALLQRLLLFALFTKHPGYEEEQEWRVAYIGDRDRKKDFEEMFSYFSGARGIDPKLKLDFRNFAKLTAQPTTQPLSFVDTVDRIILGPTAGGPYAVEAMKRMLSASGKEQINVFQSSIPFRRTSTS
jgi:Protein of unknown function (DUF2971)